MTKVSKMPIFIHSLFRTGSTYLWNKFRQDERYFCYYEPFNQIIAELNEKNPAPLSGNQNVTTFMRHPHLNRDYLFEYQKLCQAGPLGIPNFKKSFSFDDFCNNNANPDQKQYIDFLIKNTRKKIPLLQFNRSSLRIRWFKEYYPASLHIYLVRNPFDQFCSYLSMEEEQKLDIFFTMDLIVTGVNRNNGIFKDLALYLPLLEYHGLSFADEEMIYKQLVPIYSTEEKFFIFYYIWFAALIENLLNSSLILNINFLSDRIGYWNKINLCLQEFNIDAIDFSDCKIQEWTCNAIPKNRREEIQEIVHSLIWKQYTEPEISVINKNLDSETRAYFNIRDAGNYRFKEIKRSEKELSQQWVQKCHTLYANYSPKSTQLVQQINLLAEELNIKKSQVVLLRQNLLEEANRVHEDEHDLRKHNKYLMIGIMGLEKNIQGMILAAGELGLKIPELALKEQQLGLNHQELVGKTPTTNQNEQQFSLDHQRFMTQTLEIGKDTQQITQALQKLTLKTQDLTSAEEHFTQALHELTVKNTEENHKKLLLSQVHYI